MSSWFSHPLTLTGELVKLVPLEETHFDALIQSSNDPLIWEFMSIQGTDAEKLRTHLMESLELMQKGEQYTFVVIDQKKNCIMGCTSFLKVNPTHRNIEIGWTWYLPAYWSKGYNEECKLLMLTYCFEQLKTLRVQIVANEKNMRSRKAIERIGAKFEGVLRKNIIRYNGPRSSAFHSIIDDEWPQVKQNLTSLLQTKMMALRNS